MENKKGRPASTKKIYKYDGQTGNLLATYNTRRECIETEGYTMGALCHVLSGMQKTLGKNLFIETEFPTDNIFVNPHVDIPRFLTIVQEASNTGFKRISYNYTTSAINVVLNLDNDEELLDYIITDLLPNSDLYNTFIENPKLEDQELVGSISVYVSVRQEPNIIKNILHKKFNFNTDRCQL